ncbi:hypothetical protein ALO61_102333 [Pseudomonas savastanoi pv. nerii]|uniref:hypothetical protein n=1 Tax=Pseudomonas savastanoi TaxID=29438 RepID=UPI0006E7189F|nr:hypothetical protein [Pseudomonas savastanoi]KPY05801.1 hypothetical protein ALO61_102333 [Pseudomonas savastanoi pv. nerii]KWS47867.1 hypothetical protein AL058_17645 [Pseudomonas savastanoi pv. nerii]
MQAQHIIILVGIGVCFLLLTVFIVRAIKRAIRRSYLAGKSAGIANSSARIDTLNADIAMLASDREHLLLSIELKDLAIEHLKEQLSSGNTSSLTKADLQVMSDTAITLGLAHKTWVHVKGTEPWRTRATTQLQQLNAIVLRILGEIRDSNKPTESPIDVGEAA